MVGALNLGSLDEPQPKRVAKTISERLSEELVIALVGPVASGVSTAAEYLRSILSDHYGYKVAPIIKPSDIIRAEAYRVGKSPLARVPSSGYIQRMQDIGNELRKKFGGDYLAEKAIEKIVAFRTANGGYQGDVQVPGRRAYIVDSIKNVEELNLLRHVYRETLCTFGVFAPDHIRRQRLKDLGTPESEITQILARDQGEVATFGQMTRKIFVEADFFICNDLKREELQRKIARYLAIIFGFTVHTPTLHESAMYNAMAVAARSACMSRQVGAAILSEKGELISVGWNDVPKFRGGLYTEEDQSTVDLTTSTVQDRDNRCFKWGGNVCHNETRRTKILDLIASKVINSPVAAESANLEDVRRLLAGTDVDNLTEFSRSIHAEMEAILACAREGRHSLKGATLFTTTYPCHNCARHIVAAGITSVVYIEPYLKSLATALHHDAITEDPGDTKRVVFRQFDGVAPRHFLKLFRPGTERKRGGEVFQPNPKTAVPILRIPLDGTVDYESKVIADLAEKEQDSATAGEG